MGRLKKFSKAEIFETTKQLLLKVGYEGFTIGHVAEDLQVSRAAVYKYYTNKEALIVDFMLEQMQEFMIEIEKMNPQAPFKEQLLQLMEIIFESKDLHQILSYVHFIEDRDDAQIKEQLTQLSQLHRAMYGPLSMMVKKGKEEQSVKESIPEELILGFIFQTIAIPNHSHIEETLFKSTILEMVMTGITPSK